MRSTSVPGEQEGCEMFRQGDVLLVPVKELPAARQRRNCKKGLGGTDPKGST